MLPTLIELQRFGLTARSEIIFQATQALGEPAGEREWGAWFSLCEIAYAAGVSAPDLAEPITRLEIIRAYRELKRNIPEIKDVVV